MMFPFESRFVWVFPSHVYWRRVPRFVLDHPDPFRLRKAPIHSVCVCVYYICILYIYIYIHIYIFKKKQTLKYVSPNYSFSGDKHGDSNCGQRPGRAAGRRGLRLWPGCPGCNRRISAPPPMEPPAGFPDWKLG